jgi:hypothetical protein
MSLKEHARSPGFPQGRPRAPGHGGEAGSDPSGAHVPPQRAAACQGVAPPHRPAPARPDGKGTGQAQTPAGLT